MTRFILIACICIQARASSAQFFGQQATQQKLLLEQVVALAQYAREARQGYQAVQQGLAAIEAITNGELTLHTIFFAGLAGINPQLFLYVQMHFTIGPRFLR
ncbi:hypothetical protein [Dinghuibacter silviterrae]|uniref:Outer membrane efflux protein n=1 Tax=Dinghuibacter silviterrae TaxID=1539049 RepID=A0A4R8DU24_9BACT|nr:hypothetical protein [Dinghuibacter silviterrae]TDX01840.1 hypothetical protein EDB95_2883 [Dinghuibacter silviterrae]